MQVPKHLNIIEHALTYTLEKEDTDVLICNFLGFGTIHDVINMELSHTLNEGRHEK